MLYGAACVRSYISTLGPHALAAGHPQDAINALPHKMRFAINALLIRYEGSIKALLIRY
jgi:hypothetical protein